MADLSTVRSLARDSAQEAFDQLPSTEPERSRLADPNMPSGFWSNEISYITEEIGRSPTDEEKEVYKSTWEERYAELMVEDGIANNIKDAYSQMDGSGSRTNATATEHRAIIHQPDKYEDLNRSSARFGNGIDVVFGIKPEEDAGPRGGRTEIQSLVFDSRIFDKSEVKDFLDNNDFDATKIVEASGSRENPHGSGYGMPWSAIAAVGGFVLGSFVSSDN